MLPPHGVWVTEATKVVEFINSKMAYSTPPPPVSQEDIIVSHMLGKRSDTGDRRRVVVVRFNKVTVRDGVIRARSRLRNRACKWVTIHGVTPRGWSLLGSKRDNWGLAQE